MVYEKASGKWLSRKSAFKVPQDGPNYESELRESNRTPDAVAPENTEKHDSFRTNKCMLINANDLS